MRISRYRHGRISRRTLPPIERPHIGQTASALSRRFYRPFLKDHMPASSGQYFYGNLLPSTFVSEIGNRRGRNPMKLALKAALIAFGVFRQSAARAQTHLHRQSQRPDGARNRLCCRWRHTERCSGQCPGLYIRLWLVPSELRQYCSARRLRVIWRCAKVQPALIPVISAKTGGLDRHTAYRWRQHGAALNDRHDRWDRGYWHRHRH